MKGLTVVLTIIGLLVPITASPEPADEYESLKGLKKVVVIIVVEDEIWSGIREESLRTTAELKLRLAGIEVVDANKKSDGWLFVNLTLKESIESDELQPVTFFFQLRLYQNVTLKRDSTISALAPTWGRSILKRSSRTKTIPAIERILKTFLDRFLNEYLKANPITR